MIRRALFAGAMIAMCAGALHARDAVEARYVELKDGYAKLTDDKARKLYRHNWLKLVKGFVELERRYPKSARADDALYMAAKLYEELYEVSFASDDLRDAVRLNDELAKKYPSSNLADDALVRAARILERLGDKSGAFERYERCVARHPRGDLTHEARKAAKRLAPKVARATATPAPTPKPPAAPADELAQILSAELGVPVLTRVDHWSDEDYTRVVIETSEKVDFEHALIEKSDGSDLPRRLYFDLHGAARAPDIANELPIHDGLLERVRVGEFNEDTVRVVLDFDNVEDFTVFPLLDPFRIVVDVTGRRTAPEAGAPWVVVIDAGHGGKDPGAMSKHGGRESLITLGIAREVNRLLAQNPRVKPVMTRATDEFIPLPGRTAIANRAGADLFVSIHINAARNRDAAGVEIYHFAPRARPEHRELVAAENQTDAESVVALDDLITVLNLSHKHVESQMLARAVHTRMLSNARARYADVVERKVHSAPFYVLLGARMPAVLVECGFITNSVEGKRLKDAAYQKELAKGIADGIMEFLEGYQ
ncbi:N-acetylmuramoyl-L-alanine amidase [bacterium]|nr:N-acetylmuramoyl-L-alanine amidase [bacterium]